MNPFREVNDTRRNPPVGSTCMEASTLSSSTFIPCGRPADFVIENRGEVVNMCPMCADHNVKNRGAKYQIRGPFEKSPVAPVSAGPMSAPQWPQTNAPVTSVEVKPTLPAWVIERLKAAGLTQDTDGALMLWKQSQQALTNAKNDEMELRKVCVDFLVPDKTEGTNNVELGGGFKAKAVIKFNYKLAPPAGETRDVVECVDDIIDKAPKISNEASFVCDRLFKWGVTLSLTEYRLLEEAAETDPNSAKLLKLVQQVVEKTEAAPTLEIKEPKGSKK